MMKADIIRGKLAKYHHKESDTILLEVIEGKPRSSDGGTWIEARIEDMERVTEDINFNPEASGYKKYLEQWQAEGLITLRERDTGKS